MAAREDDLALNYPIRRDMQLPPTPPEDDSDENKTGLQTPPMQTLQQLLTPDTTPPGMVLQPPRPLLRRDPSSSRANSFSTAREQQSHEFLSLVDEAESQAGEETSSDEHSTDDEKEDAIEKEPWLNIPGAFRMTPSTESSRNSTQSPHRLESVCTPSTGSSGKSVRPKEYLDPESSPSTGSSRNVAREKRYRLDTESPLEREKTYVDGSTSCAQSSRSSDEDKEDSEDSGEDDVDGHDAESSQFDHYHETEQDLDNHVSYLADNLENESATGQERSARASPASSRLSGHGRRVGNNGAPHPKGMNNPPYTVLGASNKAAEQGLLKRGSDESSRHRSEGTPSPSIVAQRRRQKVTIADDDGAKVDATPGASEARRKSWLRQHAGDLVSPDIPAEFLAAPPRNSNDLVYKHIQQANMDRFDALKEGKAVGAVVIPSEEARNHHLRHVTKRQSLRSMSDNNSSYVPSNAPKREPTLRHKKALTPQKGAQAESPESPQTTRSTSGSHSLRHEKRPLRGTGRPLQSNESSPVVSRDIDFPPLRQKPPQGTKPTPKLRHASLPIHLSTDTSLASPTSVDSKSGERRRAHKLRRSSREYRLENTHAKVENVPESIPEQKPEKSDHSTIIETTTFTSPHFLGLGAHQRDRSLGTPFSASANSDRTEMEVCEAQNVAFYPHSNDSLLVVQNRSNSIAKKKDTAKPRTWAEVAKGDRTATSDEGLRAAPVFSDSTPQSPPAIAVNGKNIHTVDSPLTNPREAPIPPVINFIPATPSHEDEEKEIAPIGSIEEDDTRSTPQRRGSLAKRARRYSDVVVRPLFGRTLVTRSHNIRPSPTASEKRDERLHPNWVPNSFWHDDDDEDEYYSDPDDSVERLPAGGDTSEHPRAKFPRNMSVRMPGFRGSGGFLLGNSLGMDRHGTNKRRPHVVQPSSPGSTQTPNTAVRRIASLDSVSTRASGDGRIFAIPGTRTRIQYVGFKPIKDKIKKRRETREDAAREKRRAELKDQIGMRIVHDA